MYDQLQAHNRWTTRLLLAGSVALIAAMVLVTARFLGAPVSDPVVGPSAALIGTAIGLAAMYLSVRISPKVALRAARAEPISRVSHPEMAHLVNVFDEVCVAAGLTGDDRPTLYVVNDPAPNAFATGLKSTDAHVAVTTGLLDTLPRYELRAVLAHEVGHILNDDIRAVTVAVATVGLVAFLADVLIRTIWFGGRRNRSVPGRPDAGAGAAVFMSIIGILALILAPLAAQALRFAVSRQREFLADVTAAELLRDPQSMVNALRRIDQNSTILREFEAATAHLWFEEPNDTAGSGGMARLARLFATHPPIGERVERLAELNAGTVRVNAPLPPGRVQLLPAPQTPPPPAPGVGSR